MAEDIMAVDERLARLEETVAKGFSQLGARMNRLEENMDRLEARMDRLEDRTDALNAKLDVSVDALSDKLQLVLERMDAHTREMRVWTEAIVKEHRADRRLMYSMLADHRVRIETLEQEVRSSGGPAPSQEP